MIYPKEFQRENPEEKKRIEAWVETKRKVIAKEPTFDTAEAAAKAAVDMAKNEELGLPSVWKEPEDIGNKYAVVHHENRERAYISGYTEVIGLQDIADMAAGRTRKRIDEIEEV